MPSTPPISTITQRRLLASLLAMCVCVPALAQSGTTPGDVSRQAEPVRRTELPTVQPQAQRLTQPSAPVPGEAVSRVTAWALSGNSLLPDTVLLPLLQAFTGVDLSLRQIREAAAVLQQAYDDAGWLARVDVPAQDITAGRVRLQIVEARMGEVRLDPAATTRVTPERLQAWVQTQQASGEPLYRPALDRGLLLADDLPGVSLAGSLQAGSQPGTTDLVLNATSEPAATLDLSLDNHNARSVGASRLSANAAWNSPAGWGERYSAQLFKSQGSDYARLSASSPLGSSGLKANLGLGQLRYDIVTPDADGRRQDINGHSHSATLDLSYPLLRSQSANLYLQLGLDQRRFQGRANGARNSGYRVQGHTLTLAGNFFDGIGRGAANSASLSWRQGKVRSGAVQVDASVAGHFDKLSWSASRQQAVGSTVSLYAAIAGQTTGNKPLDSSENFSLGGPLAVRAYPVSEASGPQGHVVQLELRWRASPAWLVTPFYDHGRIDKRRSDSLSGYSLRGAGVALTWNAPGGWLLQATLARRLGSNPNADAQTGRDQDGTLRRHRFWLSAARSF